MKRFHALSLLGVMLATLLSIPYAAGAVEPPARDSILNPTGQFGQEFRNSQPTTPECGRCDPQAVQWRSMELRISQPTNPESERNFPAVAYNENQREFLVVWENNWPGGFQDIYAQRVGINGELKSHFTVATGAHGDQKNRMQPALGFNKTNGEYLIVYAYDAQGDHVHWEVWGRRVAWNGSWLGPEFQIFSWPNRGFYHPRVAWNSLRNEYLVVASAYDTQTYKWNDVAGRLVLGDGSMPYRGHNISHQFQFRQPFQGDVAYSVADDEYLVVWRETEDSETKIFAAHVRGGSGEVLPPGPFRIAPSIGVQDHPAVAADLKGRYFVVWEEKTPQEYQTSGMINGRELNASDFVGPSFQVSYSLRGFSPAAAINPYNGAREVIWENYFEPGMYQVNYSRWVNFDNEYFQRMGAFPPFPGAIAIASGPPKSLLAYTRIYNNSTHIFGYLLCPEQSFMPIVIRP
jgi:hypothetical protein